MIASERGGTLVAYMAPDSKSDHARLHPVRVELWCPRGPEISWQVLAVEGREGLSTPYDFELELVCEDPGADAEAMLGADAELLFDRNGMTRVVCGLIVEFELELVSATNSPENRPEDELLRARVRLVPAFQVLEQELDTRVFAGQSVVEILDACLGEALAPFGR